MDPIEVVAEIQIDPKIECSNCPVLNPTLSRAVDNLKLAFTLDCGDDNTCDSDLHLQLSSDLKLGNRFFVGSKSNVNVGIVVQNFGEPAYRAQVHLSIPEPIVLARLPPECDEKSNINKTLEVICNIGNPLRYSVGFCTIFTLIRHRYIFYNINFIYGSYRAQLI